uniref:Uncharacterized protein n=1 Tax=Arundo donax TaxID=35708 RepID=A0A0A9BEW0_ARUDO
MVSSYSFAFLFCAPMLVVIVITLFYCIQSYCK